MAQELVVKIIGDATSLERAMKKSERATKRFESSVEKSTRRSSSSFAGIGKGLVGLTAGVGVTAILKDTISAASDLEQQIGKTSVVFGDSAAEVEAWANTLAESFGLSQREALATASSLGALFAPIGLTGKEAADQSRALTELGADLASFYNTDVQQALDALRSGLVGEAEPLRKYGILITETRVQQQALIDTGKKNVKNLTAQEKVLARIKIVYQDSAVAQGDFGRTSEQAAQQMKIFEAQSENLKIELGQGLLPILARGARLLNRFIKAAKGTRGEKPWWNESLQQNLQDLGEALPGPLGDFSRRFPLPFTRPDRPDVPEFPLTPEPFTQATAIAERTAEEARKLANATKKVSAGVRRANEAFRELVQDRAAFAVERATATAALSDDLAALNKYNALLARRIRGGHATLELEREQFQVQQQIADVLKQQAEKRAEQREARQFRALGLGPGGADLVPSAEVLRKQLGSAEKALQGTFLDTKKTRSLVARIRKVLSGAMGAISEDVRSTIQRLIDDLRQMQDKSRIDLDRWQTAGRGQFVFAATGASRPINVNVQIDGKTVAKATAKHNENELGRRHKQRSHSRRTR